jgi:6-phosphogluconolactonase/glucosamine-6-phosphate isomerase/deaminase
MEVVPLDGAGPSYDRVRCFTLDEYVGLPAGHPQGYRATILAQVTDDLGIAHERVTSPDPSPDGLPEAGARYEAALVAAGGVDLQVLGIGEGKAEAVAAASRLARVEHYREVYASKPRWQGL